MPGTPPATSGVVRTALRRAALFGSPVTFARTGSAPACATSIATVTAPLLVPVNSGRIGSRLLAASSLGPAA